MITCCLVVVGIAFVVSAGIAWLLIEGAKLYYDWQAGCAHKRNEKRKALRRAGEALQRRDQDR